MSIKKQIEDSLEIAKENEGILPITFIGDPILKRKCEKYDGQFSKRLLKKLINAMKNTMEDYDGVGLSANQIGVSLSLFVAQDLRSFEFFGPDDERNFQKLEFLAVINPKITPLNEDGNKIKNLPDFPYGGNSDFSGNVTEKDNFIINTFYEGCLSVPGYEVRVSRYNKILLEYLDENLDKHKKILSGWPARIIQHEFEHLNGEMFIYKSHIKTIKINDLPE